MDEKTVENERFWVIGDEFILSPTKVKLTALMNALLLCNAKMVHSHSGEIKDCEWVDSPKNCSVVLIIKLPVGLEDKFEELAGITLEELQEIGVVNQ